jgi:NADH:ubiquinone oxidoreductase subunit F (NADH-binding)
LRGDPHSVIEGLIIGVMPSVLTKAIYTAVQSIP